jgi:putative heme iron utilization protein
MDAETRLLLGRLIRGERIAHLATLRDGAPMVSMTLYMPEQDFSAFYVHVSRLAWHTQDMQHDGRAALSISERDDGRADPFTLMRVTIRGDAAPISGGPKDAWLARFPEQEINFRLADFSF